MNEIDKVFRQYFGTAPRNGDISFRAEIQRKAFPQVLRGIDEAKRTITFASSTETPDRYGDVIRVQGWETKNYEKNPVFLFAHRSGEPPIGKCLSIVKEMSPAPALVQTIEFADAKTYPFADTIFRLYQGGFMRAVSVGFRSLKRPTPITDQETGNTTGYEFTKQELLELSAVPIPANPEALARAIDSGIVREAEVERFFSLDEEIPNDLVTRADVVKLQASASRYFASAARLISALKDSGEHFESEGRVISSVEQLEALWRL